MTTMTTITINKIHIQHAPKVSWAQDVHNHAMRLSHVRANWPTTPRGKLLTDKRISQLMAQGYYLSPFPDVARKQMQNAQQSLRPKLKRKVSQQTKQQRQKFNKKELLALFQ